MKAIKIILAKDKEIALHIPGSWEEVSVGQYVRLEAEGWNGEDDLHLLSILSGHSLKELDNSKDHKALDALREHIKFIVTEPPDFNALAIGKSVVLGGKEVMVPQDLELETLGQKILVSNLLQQDNVIKQIANAVAIYLQPIYDGGEFDRKRLPAMVRRINLSPIMEVYPIVSFFFLKLKEYKRNGVTF